MPQLTIQTTPGALHHRNPSTEAATSHTCYFSLPPRPTSHFSDETPCTSPISGSFSPLDIVNPDPNNPLLALRQIPEDMSSPSSGDRILQLQTSAAHGPTRPRPQPLQDMFVTSDDSSDSSSSIDSTIQSVRCSRCHRTSSIDSSKPDKGGMLRYGLNQWYCIRCATIVGYTSKR